MRKLILTIFSTLLIFWCSNDIVKIEENINTESLNNIVALWDSLTAWYNLDLADSYPSQLEDIIKENWYNYKITNAWVSSDTSKNLLNRIKLYDEIKADIYLLNIWSNDWLRKQNIKTMKENIIATIDYIKTINPESKIVLFWMQLPLNVWLNYSIEFKNTFKEISKEKKTYFYDFFLEWVARDLKLNLNDWIHPNKEWYKIISSNIYTFLKENNLLKK